MTKTELKEQIAVLQQSINGYNAMSLQEAHKKDLGLIKKAYDHDLLLLSRYKEELELRENSTPVNKEAI